MAMKGPPGPLGLQGRPGPLVSETICCQYVDQAAGSHMTQVALDVFLDFFLVSNRIDFSNLIYHNLMTFLLKIQIKEFQYSDITQFYGMNNRSK